MLAALEACLPAALHSAAYAHLSHLSKADEARLSRRRPRCADRSASADEG
jgi:hypothetical protein